MHHYAPNVIGPFELRLSLERGDVGFILAALIRQFFKYFLSGPS